MSAPARWPGRRTRLERGLDGGGDEPRGLRVDDDVPAEQNAADDLPGMRGRIVRADGGGLGHTRTVEEAALVRLLDTPDLQRLLRRSPGGPAPVRGSLGDPVANRSIYNTASTPSEISPDRRLHNRLVAELDDTGVPWIPRLGGRAPLGAE